MARGNDPDTISKNEPVAKDPTEQHGGYSINKIIFFNMLVIPFIITILLGYFWISDELTTFDQESETLRKDYFISRKAMLKSEVEQVVEYIRYRKSKSDRELKQFLKSMVSIAHDIAKNIYRENAGILPDDRIKAMILTALREIRFNQGRGYFFIADFQGTEILYPVAPHFENKSVWNLQDAKGNFVVRDEIEIVKRKKEGFVTAYWKKPGSEEAMIYPKLSFVKRFDFFDWYIGTGEYLDDFDNDLKMEILRRLVTIRFGEDGYFFGSTFNGEPLFTNGKITVGTESVWDLTDPNGVRIIQRQREAVKNPEGGFFYYAWFKLGGEKPSPKISFSKAIPDWEWMIGAGLYVDEIEKVIAKKRAELHKRIRNHLLKIVVIMVGVSLLICIIAKLISDRIGVNFNIFSSFFESAATESIRIDSDSLYYSEFQGMAYSANRMVDERHRAEKALQESEERFRQLADATWEAIVIHDSGKLLQANDQFFEMFGYCRRELMGIDVLPITVVSEAIENIKQHIREGKLGPYETLGVKKDGTRFPIEIRIRKIESQGRILRVAAIRDMTAHRKAEREKMQLREKLERYKKMDALGMLAGGVAHDLNNILSGIVGYPDLILSELEPDHHLRKPIETIRNSGERASAVVQDLLTITRGIASPRKVLDLNELIGDALNSPEMEQLKYHFPDVRFETGLATDLPCMIGSAVHLKKMFLNLIINAAEAVEDRGSIVISTENRVLADTVRGYDEIKPGNYVVVSVRDDGPGISEQETDRIFEPFYSKKIMGRSGTGLGLTIVWNTVKDHDGFIDITSGDDGTLFELFFPATNKRPSADVPTSRAQEYMGNGENILLVDDEMQQRELGVVFLKKLGYRAHAVGGGEEAIEYVKKNPVDLVVLDMLMEPGINGYETYKKILKIHPKQKAIITSGYAETELVMEAKALGANQFVKKPFGLETLARAIKRELAG